MIDSCDLDGQEDAVILSKDVHGHNPLVPMQVTIAELGNLAPTVCLYRFVNGEEVEYMELNGAEMVALIKAYTTKHLPSLQKSVDIAPALHKAKNNIERIGQEACPERAVNAILQDLVRELVTLLLPPEKQEQIEHFLDRCVQHALEQSTPEGLRI